MSKLTASEKNLITEDWLRALPFYKKYRPLHLLRRNGPIVTGVYLSPIYGGEHYCPVFHTHSLLVRFPVISIFTPTYMLTSKGARESISPLRHSKDFSELFLAFVGQAPFVAKANLSLTDLRLIYQKGIESSSDPLERIMLADSLIVAWCKGEKAGFDAIEKNFNKMIMLANERGFEDFDLDGWKRESVVGVKRAVTDRDLVSELGGFKLLEFPDLGLACD